MKMNLKHVAPRVSLFSQVPFTPVMSSALSLSLLPVSLAVSKSVFPAASSLSDRSEILFFLPVSEHPPPLFSRWCL